MNIIVTNHAKVRMLQRKITEENIASIIDKPDVIEKSFKERITVRRKIHKRTLEVVYKKLNNRIIIITCYWTKEE